MLLIATHTISFSCSLALLAGNMTIFTSSFNFNLIFCTFLQAYICFEIKQQILLARETLVYLLSIAGITCGMARNTHITIWNSKNMDKSFYLLLSSQLLNLYLSYLESDVKRILERTGHLAWLDLSGRSNKYLDYHKFRSKDCITSRFLFFHL